MTMENSLIQNQDLIVTHDHDKNNKSTTTRSLLFERQKLESECNDLLNQLSNHQNFKSQSVSQMKAFSDSDLQDLLKVEHEYLILNEFKQMLKFSNSLHSPSK
ncbi:hypothetical protein CROQUDRAFT_458632 [Cronartium quercuum f. sp. fusiforme G11]|uniref:Uncharacterized protein n=1 Tax=Cronartium quercuum f. sp. fusiforme G11 TaxID=708437 RepID=A0A9P6NIF4_9BASI|nr:hypothetical protein CROQUDRAFT_458632 [Cronartium quercuum f. sp. fusiforme G11]